MAGPCTVKSSAPCACIPGDGALRVDEYYKDLVNVYPVMIGYVGMDVTGT